RFVGALDVPATLAKYGETPLPPYIRRPPGPEDRARYQTVYAAHDGSVAAPTAGLHFTRELLEQVRASGTAVATLDLHVGPGTFKPVEVDDLARHPMHAEPYAMSEEAAATINGRREAGGRIWAVGTTVVRTLETCADAQGVIRPGAGETALFIYPPYRFRAADPAPRHGRDAGVHARRHAGDGADALPRRLEERRRAARPREHLSPPRASRRGRGAAARRPAPLHGVGSSAPHRLGWLPGVLAR